MISDTTMKAAIDRLRRAGVDSAVGDARKLAEHAATIAPADGLLATFEACIRAREGRQPVSQITGTRSFWTADFLVTTATLDPRPETEILVERAIAHDPATVLELGVGTGAVILSVLSELPRARGQGTDISEAALEVARTNAARLGLADRIGFAVSDWFSGVDGTFDVILCNPPYIPASEMDTLQPEVKDWEPHRALCPGPEGLEAYRAIAAHLGDHLAEQGHAIFEFGHDQADAVSRVFCEAGFGSQRLIDDLSGKCRAIEIASK